MTNISLKDHQLKVVEEMFQRDLQSHQRQNNPLDVKVAEQHVVRRETNNNILTKLLE